MTGARLGAGVAAGTIYRRVLTSAVENLSEGLLPFAALFSVRRDSAESYLRPDLAAATGAAFC